MSGPFMKKCGWGTAFVLCAAALSLAHVEAGGRRCACYSQPVYATAAPSYVPTAGTPSTAAATNGRLQYQSAYQAPAANAPAPTYYAAPVRVRSAANSPWDQQSEFARHIKGL